MTRITCNILVTALGASIMSAGTVLAAPPQVGNDQAARSAYEQILDATGLDLETGVRTPVDLTEDGARVVAGLHEHANVNLRAWPDTLPDSHSFVIPLDGALVEVTGVKRSLRADGYAIVADRGNGVFETLDPGPVRTYRGVVVGEADTDVRFSLGPRGVSARVRHPGGVWHVEPTGVVGDDRFTRHAVYRPDQVVPIEGTCGVDGGAPIAPEPAQAVEHRHHPAAVASNRSSNAGQPGGDDNPLAAGGGSGSGGYYRAEIAFDADYEYYDSWGSVAEVEAEINNIVNNVDSIYEDQVAICYSITYILVRTNENDPYDSIDAGARLDSMQLDWQQNQGHVNRDVAHLLTGVNLAGSTVGLAFRPGIGCDAEELAYGLSEEFITDSIQAHVVSHELGHNWGACHCNLVDPYDCDSATTDSDCGIMYTIAPRFSGDTYFNTDSWNQITAHRDSVASCILQPCACGSSYFVAPHETVDLVNLVSNADCGSVINALTGTYPLDTVSGGDGVLASTNGPKTIAPLSGEVRLEY